MSFLQPLMLMALPLMALPVIIHLLNQRRFQTVPWGAMQFLLAANRMSRGYARIRQWLILAMRTVAVAGLIFAISRPLSSGWLGATAGKSSEVSIVLLDRSPSMQQRGESSVDTKLSTGVRQLDEIQRTLRTQRVVLIDSASQVPRELEANESLTDAAESGPSDAAADIPELLLTALDYLQNNTIAQADVWICSDLRANDWKPADGRWNSIRNGFAQFGNRVRLHLLAYPEVAETNRTIRVTKVQREASAGDNDAALLLSLKIHQAQEGLVPTAGSPSEMIPVEFEINGARSVKELELTGSEAELNALRIPIDSDQDTGWGRVSIPGDLNAADNQFYFVFDNPPPRQSVIVSNDPNVARPLQLAAGIPPTSDDEVQSQAISETQLQDVDWADLALLIWHGALPRGETLQSIERWVARGGRVVFFPPKQPDDAEAFGLKWGSWQTYDAPAHVRRWRGDSDLLANTQSGQSLPVGSLEFYQVATMVGDFTPLASLEDDQPLWVRAPTSAGGVYFCATTTAPSDSTLASEGVVLYVAIQRASLAGAEALRTAGSFVAGQVDSDLAQNWQRIAGLQDRISSEQATSAGVYKMQETLTALNRPEVEDRVAVVSDSQVELLFESLSFDRVDETAGDMAALVREIWRLFLVSMMVALFAEAVLCLPRSVTGANGL